MHSYKVTITDSDGTVIDTGWITLKGTPTDLASMPLVGSALFDEILERGLANGIFDTRRAAENNPS